MKTTNRPRSNFAEPLSALESACQESGVPTLGQSARSTPAAAAPSVSPSTASSDRWGGTTGHDIILCDKLLIDDCNEQTYEEKLLQINLIS